MINLKLKKLNRIKTLSSLVVPVILAGCHMFPAAPKPTTLDGDALSSLYTPVASSAAGLWWPLLFSGFLAILAGIVNAVIFRGGHKLFLLGILLAAIPPVSDYMMRQSSLIISLTVLTVSLMMLVWVAGKWFGWKALGKELKPLTHLVKDKRNNYTAEEAVTIIEGVNNKSPKKLQSKIQGEL